MASEMACALQSLMMPVCPTPLASSPVVGGRLGGSQSPPSETEKWQQQYEPRESLGHTDECCRSVAGNEPGCQTVAEEDRQREYSQRESRRETEAGSR